MKWGLKDLIFAVLMGVVSMIYLKEHATSFSSFHLVFSLNVLIESK